MALPVISPYIHIICDMGLNWIILPTITTNLSLGYKRLATITTGCYNQYFLGYKEMHSQVQHPRKFAGKQKISNYCNHHFPPMITTNIVKGIKLCGSFLVECQFQPPKEETWLKQKMPRTLLNQLFPTYFFWFTLKSQCKIHECYISWFMGFLLDKTSIDVHKIWCKKIHVQFLQRCL